MLGCVWLKVRFTDFVAFHKHKSGRNLNPDWWCAGLRRMTGNSQLCVMWRLVCCGMSEVFSIELLQSLLPLLLLSACYQVYQFSRQIKKHAPSAHVTCSVCSVKSAFKPRYCSTLCPVRQQSTSVWLWRDGAYLNSCGDFVLQCCCHGNMSHFR